MTTTHPQESRTDRVAPSATTPSSTGSIDVASLPSPGIEQQVPEGSGSTSDSSATFSTAGGRTSGGTSGRSRRTPTS